MKWNAFRAWYAERHGRVSKEEQSTLYKAYQETGEVPVLPAATGRRASPKRSPPRVPGKGKERARSPEASPRTSPKKRSTKQSPKRSPKKSPRKARTEEGEASAKQSLGEARQVPRLCDEVRPFRGRWLDVAGLICAQLSATKVEWSQILTGIQDCRLGDCAACTDVGYRIARSLIRIATTRIFASPEQSIQEPVVNSLDAYSPERRVGKFGLGFLSQLYWLVGHPTRSMTLASTYLDEEGQLCDYQATVEEREYAASRGESALQFRLDDYQPGSGMRAKGDVGLTLRIDADHDPFTEEQVKSFIRELDKLRYVQGVQLEYSDGVKTYTNGVKDKRRLIRVDVDRKRIRVVDHATGVPLRVFLSSLLVPSVSTKTIQLAEERTSTGKAAKKADEAPTILVRRDAKLNQLLVMLGDVAVVSLESASPTYTPMVFRLVLPGTTRVPVSRDDVILTGESRRSMRDGIVSLLNQSAGSDRRVDALQTLLKQYVAYTPNTDNQNVVRNALDAFYTANKHRLVPAGHETLYQRAGWDFVNSRQYDVASVEAWLDAHASPDRTIWYGVRVLVLPGVPARVTNGGLYGYLFIDAAYVKGLGKDWVRTVTSSYFQTKLYPIGAPYARQRYERYDVRLAASDPGSASYEDLLGMVQGGSKGGSKEGSKEGMEGSRVQGGDRPSDILHDGASVDLFFTILLKLDSLSPMFDGIDAYRSVLIVNLLAMSVYLGREAFLTICGELLRKMGTFIGNQTYGGSKYRLESQYAYQTPLNLVREVNNSRMPEERRIPYVVEHVIATIRAVREADRTILELYTINSPYILSQKVGGTTLEIVTGTSMYGILYVEAARQSANFSELSMVVDGAGRAFTAQEGVQYREGIAGFVSHMLFRVRARHDGDIQQLTRLYEVTRNGRPGQTGVKTLSTLIQDRIFAAEWVSSVTRLEDVKVGTLEGPGEEAVSVSLSKLIRYLFRHELTLTDGFFAEVAASAEEDATPLQVIEIAVNEGTVKPALEATMTELLQNSRDAFSESRVGKGIRNGTGKVEMAMTRSEDGSTVTFSITDHVGMDMRAFVYVGVPFLSTKTPSEQVTGEMGSGFFNAYREATLVVVDSTRDGVRRVSHDTPVRDRSGRVVDILKRVSVTRIKPKPKGGNVTTVSVVMPTPDRLSYISRASRAEYTSRYVLSLSNVVNLTYNGTRVYLARRLDASVGPFRLYSTHGMRHDSYVLTKGIPFQPLSAYTEAMLTSSEDKYVNTRYLLDVTHGGYTPVQTRTKIRLSPEAERDLVTVVVYGMFVGALRAYVDDEEDDLIPHTRSTASAQQLMLTIYRPVTRPEDINDSRFLLYTSFMGQPTLAQLINDSIGVMGDRRFKEAATDIMEGLQAAYRLPAEYQHVQELVQDAVTRWLKPKNATGMKATEISAGSVRGISLPSVEAVEQPPGEEGDGKERVYAEVADDVLTRVADAWIRAYWKVAREEKVTGYGRQVPRARGVVSERPASGWYTAHDHTITLNGNTYDRRQLLEIEQALRSDRLEELVETTLKANRMWEDKFSYRFPSSTLIHELEHARRRKEHAGTHDGVVGRLWPTDESVGLRSFDQAANAVYARVLGQGFYKQLAI
jgi:hypothetical protein